MFTHDEDEVVLDGTDADDIEVDIEEEDEVLDGEVLNDESVPEETGDPSADPFGLDSSLVEVDQLDSEDEDVSLLSGEGPNASDLAQVDVAFYRITGLVDYTDEQGNIVGQLPIGSECELPTIVGDQAVADGRAEKVE